MGEVKEVKEYVKVLAEPNITYVCEFPIDAEGTWCDKRADYLTSVKKPSGVYDNWYCKKHIHKAVKVLMNKEKKGENDG